MRLPEPPPFARAPDGRRRAPRAWPVGPDARAQEAPSGPTGEELFGSYTLEARGQGMRVRYEIEGMLPGGAPGARPRDAGGAGPLHLGSDRLRASPRSPIPAASS